MKKNVETFLNLKGLIEIHAPNDPRFTGPIMKLELQIREHLKLSVATSLNSCSDEKLSDKDGAELEKINTAFQEAELWKKR